MYISLSRLGLPADIAGELVRNWMRHNCPVMPECVHLTERAHEGVSCERCGGIKRCALCHAMPQGVVQCECGRPVRRSARLSDMVRSRQHERRVERGYADAPYRHRFSAADALDLV